MAELDAAFGVGQVSHAGAVGHIDGGIQQLGDTVQGGLAAAGLFDQHGHSHDGPDDGLKVADVLHQLAGVESALIDQITAVTQNDADHGLHEQGHQHLQQGGDLRVGHVDLFVFLVQLPEGLQFLVFLDKGLDDRNAGKVLLREIGKAGEGLLPLLPAPGHHLAHLGADGKHDQGRDQSQQGQPHVHGPHLIKGQQTQGQRVEEHQHTVTKALLNGVQVVGVQAHQVADLVHLIVLLGQPAAVVEHPLPQVCRDPHRRAEETDAPQKAPNDHQHHDPDHGQADVLQQHLFGKEQRLTVHHHLAKVHTVDDQPVELRDQKLDVIHRQQGGKAQQQYGSMLEVIPVDVLAEYHCVFPSFSNSKKAFNVQKSRCITRRIMFCSGLFVWSGRRGSNSLPPPWQGGALPDELRPHIRCVYPRTHH